MSIGEVRLRRGEERGLAAGGCWVYDNQVAWVDEDCVDGGIADVIRADGEFLGRGFFNGQSKIVVRLLTRQKIDVDEELIRGRIFAAWQRRKELGFKSACRVVFGDADGLPGLTVDKFDDYLSYQIVSAGMERFQHVVVNTLVELFHPQGICRRNDVAVREKEGLPLISGCIYGNIPDKVEFWEHDARMQADLLRGQKTGHYLDQQENRGRIRPYCQGRDVLDLCCHTGGFSIHAALYGAKSVEAVDASADALTMLMENAKRNGVENVISTVNGNVFDLVRSESDAGKQYGLVICDPPAFAKSRKALEGAYRGYRELNSRCMKLVAPGGILATFSCSQFMTAPLFLQMLQEAAVAAGREAQLLEKLMQSRDHPATLSSETSSYLKGYILRIL